MSPHESMVATALKDAKQAFQDFLEGKEESAPPAVDPEDLAAVFFAKQQPARLEVKEWVFILQRQEGTKTTKADDETHVKVSQQEVDALYQEYFNILLNE